MKKLILTVVLVIGMITTTFAQFGDTEKSYNKNRIQDKQEYNNTIMGVIDKMVDKYSVKR